MEKNMQNDMETAIRKRFRYQDPPSWVHVALHCGYFGPN